MMFYTGSRKTLGRDGWWYTWTGSMLNRELLQTSSLNDGAARAVESS
jgi:hypothetical protein